MEFNVFFSLFFSIFNFIILFSIRCCWAFVLYDLEKVIEEKSLIEASTGFPKALSHRILYPIQFYYCLFGHFIILSSVPSSCSTHTHAHTHLLSVFLMNEKKEIDVNGPSICVFVSMCVWLCAKRWINDKGVLTLFFYSFHHFDFFFFFFFSYSFDCVA